MGCSEFIRGTLQYIPCTLIGRCGIYLIANCRCYFQVFSREYSHKDFCLAHLFTDLKFEGGILGLAYVGSPRRNSVGGICTPG